MGLRIAVGKKSGERVMVESMQTVLALLCLIAACVAFCDAAAVVDVYRIIKYDFGGMPFGSRRAALHHHAGSKLFRFNVKKKGDSKVKLEGSEQVHKGHLAIAAEIFEVTPSLFVVEVSKAGGDTLEYNKFCNPNYSAVRCCSQEGDAVL